MVEIQGGAFAMGVGAGEADRYLAFFGTQRLAFLEPSMPRHEVVVADFYLDRHEVTNRQFQEFLRARPEWSRERMSAGQHNGEYLANWLDGSYPEGQGDFPVTHITWHAAAAYAAWAGKRLPTEAEWEYAARGGLDNAAYPWGDDSADPSRTNSAASGLGRPQPVGSYEPNAYGLFDMAGNVWEYCYDPWRDSYADGPGTSPQEVSEQTRLGAYLREEGRRVIRGGSWGGAPINLWVAFRDSHPVDGAGAHVGFRCARSAE